MEHKMKESYFNKIDIFFSRNGDNRDISVQK